MKKNLFLLIIMFVFLSGCNTAAQPELQEKKTNPQETVFGPELYSGCLTEYDGEAKHIIPFLSKYELQPWQITVDGSGGTFSYDINLEKHDFKLDDYQAYRLVILLKEIDFSADKITIDSINVFPDDQSDKKITLQPYRCEVLPASDTKSFEHVVFNASPISTTENGVSLRITKSEEFFDQVLVDGFKIINPDFSIICYDIDSPEFVPRMLDYEPNYTAIKAFFELPKDEVSKYRQYATSLAVTYVYQEKSYVTYPPIVRSTSYNNYSTQRLPWENLANYTGMTLINTGETK